MIGRFLKYWWVYAVVCLVLIGIETFLEYYQVNRPPLIDDVVVVFFILATCLLAIAGIVSLLKKRFLVFLGILMSGLCSIILFFCLMFFLWAHSDYSDPFGKEHPIPANMTCNLTKESFCMDDIDSTDTTNWLRIHDEFQPGIYEFQYFSTALSDGYIYLICFEATENIPLSEDRIALKTKTAVKNHTEFRPVGGYHVFTVYEGDWGDFYAVRVEVWHHNTATNKETKLCEKIYKMQGWQR